MDKNKMEKLELELREYGGGGPNISRKTALDAANLIKNHRWFVYGEQQSLDALGRARARYNIHTDETLREVYDRISADRAAYPTMTDAVMAAIKANLDEEEGQDVHRPD